MSSLSVNKLKDANVVRNTWVASVPDSDRSRLAEPSYWAHVSTKLRPYDRIEVQSEEMSFWCELLVISVGTGWARVELINARTLETPVEDEADLIKGYDIKYKGPMRGHVVTRLDDMRVIKEGFDSRNAAVMFVVDHRQTMEK